MSSTTLLRVAARTSALRSHSIRQATPRCSRSALTKSDSVTTILSSNSSSPFSTGAKLAATGHHEETFEEFTARFEKEFDGVNDVFELQRNLNNAFAYDLVPSPSVLVAALRAARRVNDLPTAVRIFEGIKAKVENKGQYHQYLEELKTLREELGVPLKEDLYPDMKKMKWEK